MSAKPRPPAPGLTMVGTWNLVEGAVGIPRSGKTVRMVRRAGELARTPAYVLAHDPNANLPLTDPETGRPTGVKRLDSMRALEAELKQGGRGILAVSVVDPAPLLEVAKALPLRTRQTDAAGNVWAVPSVVLFDEMSVWDQSRPNALGADLKDLILRRRHHHVALLWITQTPRLLHRQLFGLATRVYAFRVNAPEDLARMRETPAFAPHLERIRTIPQYKSVTVEIDSFS